MPTEAQMKRLAGRFWWASRKVFLAPGLYYCHYFGNKRILPLPAPYQPPALVEFPEQTIIIAKKQPQYRPLPAYRFRDDPTGRIVCCWKLNWRDRASKYF